MMLHDRVTRMMRDVRALLAFAMVLIAVASDAHADTAQYYYDPAGRLVGVIDPVNGSSIYNLDVTGNILSVSTNPITALVVVATAPLIGTVNTGITIAGTGFGTTSNTTVSFNGVAAKPTTVTATQINVNVPAGASTGPITITTPSGTVTATAKFTVGTSSVPTVTSASPTTTIQGATVTVAGTNFDPIPTNNKIYVNNQAATVISSTATSLQLSVPAASSGLIQLSTPQGIASSTPILVVAPLGIAASTISSHSQVVFPASGGTVSASPTTAANGVGLVYFQAMPGQHATILVSSTTANGTITIYSPNGNQVISSNISNGVFLDPPNLDALGMYTIAVSSSVSSTTSINIYNASNVTGIISANATESSFTSTAAGQSFSLTLSGAAGQRVGVLTQIDPSSPLQSGEAPLSILAPDGSTIYRNPVFNYSSWFSDVVILPYTGKFNIVAQPEGTSVGTIGFTVYTVPNDAASPISSNGTQVSLTTNTPGQNMTLPFSGTAGQRISLLTQIDPSSTLQSGCSHLTIFVSDGVTPIYTNNCFNYSSSFSDVVNIPANGNYTIFADPNGSAFGTVAFTLYTVLPDVTSPISANGSSVSLITTTPGQNFDLTFSGTAGERIGLLTQIDSSSPLQAGCSQLTVFAPDGVTVVYKNSCFNYTSSFSDVVVLPTTGNYTILADPNGSAVGTIGFTLYTVPTDVTGTITAGGPQISLTSTVPGQNFSLNFSGTAGQHVSLLTQISSSSSLQAGCSPLTIFAPDGVTQIYYNSCFNYTSSFTDVLILPSSGTYTVFANPGGSSVGTIGFTLYNPQDAAGTVSPGATVSETTSTPGQNIAVTFAANFGTRVAVLTQSNFNNSCFSVNVLNPSGTSIYNDGQCAETRFSGVVPSDSPISSSVSTLTVPGTYTISINPSGTDTGTSQITLYNVPPDVPGNTTIGTAAASYSTTTPAQAIRVGFTGAANQSVTVAVGETSSVPSGGCYQITVLEPDGATILRGDSSCNASYSSGSLTLPAAGNYLIVVSPTGTTTGTYSVGVTTP